MLHYLTKLFLPNNWKIILIALLVLPLSGGRIELKARTTGTATLTNINKIDVCGDKNSKQIILVLDIGKIRFSDSLLACNFEINYNPEKIKITSALYLNTLSEFFEFREISFRTGKVIGVLSVSLNSNDPVAAERPLIAFSGDFLENCEDTTYANISYLEFTDEFQIDIPDSNFKSALIKGETADKTDRYLNAIINNKTFDKLVQDTTVETDITFQYTKTAKVQNVDLNLFFDKKNIIQINEFNSVNEKARVDSIFATDSGLVAKVSLLDTISNQAAFNVKFRNLVNSNDTVKLTVNPVNINNCSCITRKKDASATFITEKKIKDTVETVIDFKARSKSYFDYENNEFVIIDDDILKSIDLYGMNGYLLKSYSNIYQTEVRVDARDLNTGLYVILTNKIKRIILIKN